MWSIEIPNVDDCLNEIDIALTYVDGSKKYVLDAIEKESISKIYTLYDSLKGRPHIGLAGGDISDETKKAFLEGYKEIQQNGRLAYLRSKLLLSASRCPNCGIGPANQLDHYLPKNKYNLLSIYSHNLIPSCDICNKKKSTHVALNSQEGYVHNYYDIFPTDVRFFIANTYINDDSLKVVFDIVKIADFDDDYYKILKFQIDKLDLNNRLSKEINLFLCSFSIAIEDVYNSGGKNYVAYFLERNCESFAKKLGLNDWRTALLYSLSKNNDFCDGGFIEILNTDGL